MAMYRLGRSVVPQMVIRKERWLAGDGIGSVPLVSLGQEVVPEQPVLRRERTFPPPGSPVAISSGADVPLHTPPHEVVLSGLYGHVVAITARGGVIIESHAVVVQGVLGVGNQVSGVLTLRPSEREGLRPQGVMPGAILVMPGPLNFALLRQAVSSGVRGIIASSAPLRDLEGFLQTDLIQLMSSDGAEQAQLHLPPLTLLLTEGIGSFAMPTLIIELLRRYQGSAVLLSGVTSVRQRLYPDLLISFAKRAASSSVEQQAELDSRPTLGVQVRVLRGEYAGALGIIDYFFSHQQVFASGVRSAAVRLRLADGTFVVVPFSLVERIG